MFFITVFCFGVSCFCSKNTEKNNYSVEKATSEENN